MWIILRDDFADNATQLDLLYAQKNVYGWSFQAELVN